MGVAISSREDLEEWLEGKPRAWAQAIAQRAALRVLPSNCDPAKFRNRIIDTRLPMAVLGVSVISSGALKIPIDDVVAAARAARAAAARAIVIAANGREVTMARPAGFAAAAANAASARAASARAIAVSARAAAAIAAADAAEAAARSASDAAAIYVANDARAAASVWQAITNDCDRLDVEAAPSAVLDAPLWPNGLPEWLDPVWARASAWLDGSSDGFGLWREWYQRKLDGEGGPRAARWRGRVC